MAVGILHPGAVRTDMTGGHGMIDAQESVRGLLQRIDGLSLDNSGHFLRPERRRALGVVDGCALIPPSPRREPHECLRAATARRSSS